MDLLKVEYHSKSSIDLNYERIKSINNKIFNNLFNNELLYELSDIVKNKMEVWRYEQEFRILGFKNFIKLEDNTLNRIYFGCGVEVTRRRFYMNILSDNVQHYPSIEYKCCVIASDCNEYRQGYLRAFSCSREQLCYNCSYNKDN